MQCRDLSPQHPFAPDLATAVDHLVAHGWTTFDARDWLGDALLESLRQSAILSDEAGRMFQAGIGRGSALQQADDIRRDRIAWLAGETLPERALFERLDELRVTLNRDLMLGLRRFEAQYACYQPGDFYKTHLDSFRGAASRVVSVVIYLNPAWQPADAGELVVYPEEGVDIPCAHVAPKLGTAALFLSERIPHEVLPAGATRYSIAVWFRQDEEFVALVPSC